MITRCRAYNRFSLKHRLPYDRRDNSRLILKAWAEAWRKQRATSFLKSHGHSKILKKRDKYGETKSPK